MKLGFEQGGEKAYLVTGRKKWRIYFEMNRLH